MPLACINFIIEKLIVQFLLVKRERKKSWSDIKKDTRRDKKRETRRDKKRETRRESQKRRDSEEHTERDVGGRSRDSSKSFSSSEGASNDTCVYVFMRLCLYVCLCVLTYAYLLVCLFVRLSVYVSSYVLG